MSGASEISGRRACPARVVAEACGWLGTPYRHQASRRGAGCDCLGLIRGVWRSLNGADPEAMPAYTPDWGEAGAEEVLHAAACRHLLPVAVMGGGEAPGGVTGRVMGAVTGGVTGAVTGGGGTLPAPGEVLLFRMRRGGVAKHLGIAAAGGQSATFIHAMSGRGVVESALSLPWQRRLAGRFAFPDMG